MLPQEILTLAQQGDPIAIGTLLSYLMRSRGIKARVQRQDHGLHVLLEANQPLNQDKAVAFVRSSVRVLNVKGVQTIMVYGRRQGKSNLDWQQRIQLRSPSDSLLVESSAPFPVDTLFEPPLLDASSPHASADVSLSYLSSRSDAVTQASDFLPESLEPAAQSSSDSSPASVRTESSVGEPGMAESIAPEPAIAESPFSFDDLPNNVPLVVSSDESVAGGGATSEIQSASSGTRSPALSPHVDATVDTAADSITDSPNSTSFAADSAANSAADLEETPEVLKRPESVIFLLFISLFIFWDAYVDFLEADFSPENATISASQLARRLKVSRKTIRRRKRDVDFSAWTRSLDPEGIAWTYRKGYYLSQP